MKKITVLFKNIFKKIKKYFEKQDFLDMEPNEAIKDLEADTAYKVKNLHYTIRELLKMEEYDLLLKLQSKNHVENLFVFLQIEISKRGLDIDLKKYPAFKDYKLKRKDKEGYIKENLIN